MPRSLTPLARIDLIALLALLTGGGGCELGLPASSEPHRELNFLDMADQPKQKPQRGDLFGARPTGMSAPPPGALARDDFPYPYAKDEAELAAKGMHNPLSPTAANLAKGRFIFERVCIACHGKEAAGDGLVTRFFPKPPSLMTKRVRDFSDGRIFHVPMRGQNSMPSHAKQVAQDDLWAVVLHIRELQKTLPVAPPPPLVAPAATPAPAPAPAGTASPHRQGETP